MTWISLSLAALAILAIVLACRRHACADKRRTAILELLAAVPPGLYSTGIAQHLDRPLDRELFADLTALERHGRIVCVFEPAGDPRRHTRPCYLIPPATRPDLETPQWARRS